MDKDLNEWETCASPHKDKDNRRLSIVIPCYNDHLFVEHAVDSAVALDWPDKEIILVDDGSDKVTKAKLKELKSKIDRLISQDNRGLSAARNKGIALSSGEYILVLDSDDYFESGFSKKAIHELQKNKDVKLVTCYSYWFDDKEKEIFKPTGGQLKDALFVNPAMGSSMFKKKDWELVGGYDENMLLGYEDWEFYIRLLQEGGQVVVIPEPLFNYRRKNGSMRLRANKVRYDIWEYIFFKHSVLYKAHFEDYTKFLLNKLKREEAEKMKNYKRIDFRVGNYILAPLRFLKKLFS